MLLYIAHVQRVYTGELWRNCARVCNAYEYGRIDNVFSIPRVSLLHSSDSNSQIKEVIVCWCDGRYTHWETEAWKTSRYYGDYYYTTEKNN